MKKINFIFLFVISFAIISSCTKEDSKTIEPKAVVESFLHPGQPLQVKITKQIITGADNSGSRTINNLQVTITHNSQVYILTQNASGVYENPSIPVVVGGQYNLKFDYNNQTITSSTIVPAKPTGFTCTPLTITIPNFGGGGPPSFPEPLKARWDNPGSAYHYVAAKSVESNPTEISNTAGRPNFASTPDQGNYKEINFGEFKYYGRHALILYRILPDYAAFYNAAGSNSQNLSEVPTNVNNGLGIFTSLNTADTLFVQVN
jgi:hypothetical protein